MVPVATLLEQDAVRSAIAELAARAETAARDSAGSSGNTLTATYVDPALKERLASPNHQILYGRRGAGKTHALRVIEKRLAGRASELVIYADLRELGDTRSQPPQERAAAYIRQLLGIVEREFTRRSDASFAFAHAQRQLGALRDVLREQGFAVTDVTSGQSTNQTSDRGAAIKASLSPTDVGLSGELHSGGTAQSKKEETTRLVPVEQVNFTVVAGALDELCRAANLKRLTLLLDEWSEVQPLDAQAYLAEYIKRVFFPVRGLSIKIAAIQHRSRVGVRLGDGAVRGFEESADVFPLTMLDETAFSYDRDPSLVETMFAKLLYRHLTVGLAEAATEGNRPRPPIEQPAGGFVAWLSRHLPGRTSPVDSDDIISRVAGELRRPDWGKTFFDQTGDAFMKAEFGLAGPDNLVRDMFEEGAFSELVRGAQGVPRDFMSVLKDAVFSPDKPAKLTKQAVRNAIHEFHTAKLQKLTDEESRMLTALIQVTTNKQARSFLADADLTSDRHFQGLVDQRLLHRLQPRVPDPQEPARPYDVYTLDYGSYIVLIQEGKLADEDLTDKLVDRNGETVAPFGDGRRIRRIIVRLGDVAQNPGGSSQS